MNDSEILVKVENLSKKFCKDLKTSLWYGVKDLVSGVRGSDTERLLRPKEFWAVKDISFELRRGECLGLIGHNGAGKSTLLKILNGLINPDAGKVTIKGRVGALIELGAGFNPILSGRENIYNNGAILGFSRREIDAKLEDIIAFAELEDFIDMPVQHYSSGMKVRLGFAVAAQMEPDVLIIDEVLAVGDSSFRAKCFNRMTELSKTTAMIFVSHSMPLVGRICDKGLLLEKGRVQKYDAVDNVIYKYLIEQSSGIKSVVGESVLDDFTAYLDKPVVKHGDDLTIDLSFKMPLEIKKFVLHYTVLDQEMKSIYQCFSIENSIVYFNKGENRISFIIKGIDLTNGKYFINIGFLENDFNGKNICRYDSILEFFVEGSAYNSFASIVKETEWR
ncbi:ABC transporter ATP-binding protein [Aequorivita sediminis]|uniref:ABC transporter ATP-binding protein n=1 Tax=Aequorivita sediminis TaxID=3073653 RepID=UPI0028ACE1FF|nr:ABC transporter ATP-binding protein [Aequorivita sp. F6058]